MRRKFLGAIAAVAAGTGAAWSQQPPPPAPIGPAGMMPGMGSGMAVLPASHGVDPIAPPIGQPIPPADPSGLFPTPPMSGLHGQQMWEAPSDRYDYNSRIAPRWWVHSEYLLWFASAMPNQRVPFVTTSAPAAGGVPGRTSTAILHSTSDLGYNLFSGFRITGGWFRDDERRHGTYISGFWTEEKTNSFSAASDLTGQSLLARPFINAATGQIDVLLVSFPTFASGSIAVNASSESWGAEGGPMVNIYRSCPGESSCLWDINVLAGFRFLQIHETLSIQSFSSTVGTSAFPFDGKIYGAPATIEVHDQIEAYNQFYGGQVGLNSTVYGGRWSFNLTGKVALGVMHQRVDINGFSILTQGTPPSPTNPLGTLGQPAVVRAGLFANAGNIGRYNNDEFAVVPEVQATLGYAWSSWCTTTIGYTFLYANRVARPTEQYSVIVNPALIPTSPSYGLGTPIPITNPVFTQGDFWLQGISFGVQIKY